MEDREKPVVLSGNESHESVSSPVQQPIVNNLSKNGAVYAPLFGEVISLANVPAEEIASGAMGDGIAILPAKGEVYAPCDGIVATVFTTGHAVGINSDNGAEILIHVGIDTVKLSGEGFEPLVKEGDTVKAGQLLMKFDMALLKSKLISPITSVLITNSENFEQVEIAVGGGNVAPGNTILYYK
ncbi:MAG: PTS glucose transporter subunit IIA [Lachnospiraceae bacterium]|nr:PTS glucose transporter subunit IIA [Lachnospiraceae bacterium]